MCRWNGHLCFVPLLELVPRSMFLNSNSYVVFMCHMKIDEDSEVSDSSDDDAYSPSDDEISLDSDMGIVLPLLVS